MNGWEKVGLFVLGAVFVASVNGALELRGWRRWLLAGLVMADVGLSLAWTFAP